MQPATKQIGRLLCQHQDLQLWVRQCIGLARVWVSHALLYEWTELCFTQQWTHKTIPQCYFSAWSDPCSSAQWSHRNLCYYCVETSTSSTLCRCQVVLSEIHTSENRLVPNLGSRTYSGPPDTPQLCGLMSLIRRPITLMEDCITIHWSSDTALSTPSPTGCTNRQFNRSMAWRYSCRDSRVAMTCRKTSRYVMYWQSFTYLPPLPVRAAIYENRYSWFARLAEFVAILCINCIFFCDMEASSAPSFVTSVLATAGKFITIHFW